MEGTVHCTYNGKLMFSYKYAAAERKGCEAMANTIGIRNKVEIKLGEHCKQLLKCIYLYHSPSVPLWHNRALVR